MFERTRTLDAGTIGYEGATITVAASLPMGLYEKAVISLRRLADNAQQDDEEMRGVFATIREVLETAIKEPALTPEEVADLPSDLAFWLVQQVMAGIAQPLGK